MLTFVMRYEPVKYLIIKEQEELAIKAIRQMYKNAKDDKTAK